MNQERNETPLSTSDMMDVVTVLSRKLAASNTAQDYVVCAALTLLAELPPKTAKEYFK